MEIPYIAKESLRYVTYKPLLMWHVLPLATWCLRTEEHNPVLPRHGGMKPEQQLPHGSSSFKLHRARDTPGVTASPDLQELTTLKGKLSGGSMCTWTAQGSQNRACQGHNRNTYVHEGYMTWNNLSWDEQVLVSCCCRENLPFRRKGRDHEDTKPNLWQRARFPLQRRSSSSVFFISSCTLSSSTFSNAALLPFPSTSTQWDRCCLGCHGEKCQPGFSLRKPSLEAVTGETLTCEGTGVQCSRWGAGRRRPREQDLHLGYET